MLACGLGILLEEDLTVRVRVDIDKPGTYVKPFGINDLTPLGDLCFAHFTVSNDLFIFCKNDGVGDKVVAHDERSVFNCDHACSPTFFKSCLPLAIIRLMLSVFKVLIITLKTHV